MGEQQRVLDHSVSEMHVLFVLDQIGNLVGWYYHPNRAAVEDKQHELERDGSNLRYQIDRFVKMPDRMD